MRLGLPFLVLLVACDGPSDDSTTSTDVTDSTVDTASQDTDLNFALCDGDAPTEGSGLVGTVTDDAGSPVGAEQVRVQYCRGDACLDADCYEGPAPWSGYRFAFIEPGVGSFEVISIEEEVTLSTPFVPFTIGSEIHTLDVVVPKLGARVDVPATQTEVALLPELTLSVGADVLKAKDPLTPVPESLAAVDATDHALPVEGLGEGTLLAMYYLDPPSSPATEDLPITFADTVSWADDAVGAEVYVGDYDASEWDSAGTLAAVEGGFSPDGGLPRLSTVIVWKPAAK